MNDDWKLWQLPNGHYRTPSGVVVEPELILEAVEFFKNRCSTLKEMCQEIDKFYK